MISGLIMLRLECALPSVRTHVPSVASRGTFLMSPSPLTFRQRNKSGSKPITCSQFPDGESHVILYNWIRTLCLGGYFLPGLWMLSFTPKLPFTTGIRLTLLIHSTLLNMHPAMLQELGHKREPWRQIPIVGELWIPVTSLVRSCSVKKPCKKCSLQRGKFCCFVYTQRCQSLSKNGHIYRFGD